MQSFPTGKVPELDYAPNKLFKYNLDWWVDILSLILTQANRSTYISSIWYDSGILPIYKKGDCYDPANCTSTCFLPVIDKICAKYLLIKLISWTDEQEIMECEHPGFHASASGMDHYHGFVS